MFKTIVLVTVSAATLLLSSLATANEYGRHWNEHESSGQPGGYFSIHVVPPPPPRYYRPERCLPGHRVDEIQAQQSSLISAGFQEGDLTGYEMDMLLGQQDNIENLEYRMRNDGCLTVNERDDLLARLDQAGRTIWRERNDHERRQYHHNGPYHRDWSGNNR